MCDTKSRNLRGFCRSSVNLRCYYYNFSCRMRANMHCIVRSCRCSHLPLSCVNPRCFWRKTGFVVKLGRVGGRPFNEKSSKRRAYCCCDDPSLSGDRIRKGDPPSPLSRHSVCPCRKVFLLFSVRDMRSVSQERIACLHSKVVTFFVFVLDCTCVHLPCFVCVCVCMCVCVCVCVCVWRGVAFGRLKAVIVLNE